MHVKFAGVKLTLAIPLKDFICTGIMRKHARTEVESGRISCGISSAIPVSTETTKNCRRLSLEPCGRRRVARSALSRWRRGISRSSDGISWVGGCSDRSRTWLEQKERRWKEQTLEETSMKNIPASTKSLLLNLRARLPANCRQRFAEVIARELGKLEMENTLKYAVVGAAIGVIFEILPLDRITGIDDWVEIGAALGAWTGLALDWKAREERQRTREVILKALQEALEVKDEAPAA
jgi:hypothetical protein